MELMDANPCFLLASASPRRQELLAQIGARFSVAPVVINEAPLAAESPEQYVLRMALEKAAAGWQAQADAELPVMGADTAVVLGDEIFGKPDNREHAVSMLLKLSGQRHRVLSAVALIKANKTLTRVSETLVTFRSLSKEECLQYWHTGEPADKAGGYGIQGLGSVFVSRIEGSYSGVVGLPLAETSELLNAFNIPWWENNEL